MTPTGLKLMTLALIPLLKRHHLTSHPKTQRYWEGRWALYHRTSILPPSSYERGWEGYSTALRLLHLTVPPPFLAMSTTVRVAPPNQSSQNPQVLGGLVRWCRSNRNVRCHVGAYGAIVERACSHPTCATCPLAHCQRARKLIQCISGPTTPLHHLRVLGGLVSWCRSNSGIRARVTSSSPVGVMHRLPLIAGRRGGTVRCSSPRAVL
jgi:hypothetical protein